MTAVAVLETEALAQRLAEAEATIEALLSGQIDAVVDSSSQTPLLLSKAQTALSDSERLFRSTFDAAPIGIVHVGLNGKWLRVNQRLCDLLDYRCSDLISAPGQKAIHAGRVAGESDAFERIATGTLDRHVIDERRFSRRDGSVMLARVNMSVHNDAGGHPEHVILAIEDITERRAIEMRAQQYLDAAAVILLALDMEGRVTMVNRYGCSVFGWTAEELVGREFIEVCVPARIRDETRRKLASVHSGDLASVDNVMLTRTGEERLVEWRNTLTRDETGRVNGTLSSGTDITDRSKVAETVRVAEERMRFSLQAAGVGIWDMDYITGIHTWSETLEDHYGIPHGSFDGTFEAFADCIHPDDRTATLETIGRAVTTGGDFDVQNRSIWPDGSVHWLSGSGRVILGDLGEPMRAVGITLDVTERKTLEEQYQQAQKMEAVGRLAGGVAHDFNNLLMVITGYSDILLEGMIPADPRRADLQQIGKAADAAASLTRQLLTFSRQQVIEPREVLLEDAVTSALAMLQRLIGEDVDVVSTLSATPATVRIDPGQLEQIIMNLAINSRDAMPTGGKLTIETAIVQLTREDAAAHWPVKPGRFALLAVSDTGVGMDAATRAKIFEPFFTTKEQGKGTGLGLSTVYGIVNQNNGFIWVYSEPGLGATFKVYLPLFNDADTPMSVMSNTGEHLSPRGVETILLVEDSDGVRDIAQRVLERQGYKVITAAGPAIALELAKTFNGKIDLLLTDVVMPGMSGRALAETFLEQRPRTKLLYMSGYTDDAVVRHGVLTADTSYIQKPFSPHALAGRVRAVLDAT